MRYLPLLAIVAVAVTGCARFSTKQTDLSYGTNGLPLRQISTKASSYTLWESKSSLANWKASQTDKTQGASVGSLNQESGGTNTAATISALVQLMRTLKP